jgi:hypothetical protein
VMEASRRGGTRKKNKSALGGLRLESYAHTNTPACCRQATAYAGVDFAGQEKNNEKLCVRVGNVSVNYSVQPFIGKILAAMAHVLLDKR